MTKKFSLILISFIFAASCKEKALKLNMDNSIAPPKADKIPVTLEKHDDVRIDNYYWLNERENPKVINYLELLVMR